MIGALCSYICNADPGNFQPMKANFGLVPALDPPVRKKRERYASYARRALADLGDAIARFALLQNSA
jgi:methylenetetrahydrofolate--tRNA-(uracil-5-)-methyltransferase